MAPGAGLVSDGVRFAVHAATQPTLCLFEGDIERRITMAREGALWVATARGAGEGTRYGFRTEADPSKLLVDPYATAIDAPFAWHPELAEFGRETAHLVPKAVVRAALPSVDSHIAFAPGGLIYELNVRGFTMLHPEVPKVQRGTIAALGHPAVIAHLKRIGVDAVELMPIAAWIDERHLPPLGLRNAWGYNPVTMMALDPRIAPGGIAELRAAVAALHGAGIAVILDVVFNHSGESDVHGPTLSFRGLDDATYYAHAPDGSLINDTGTGNTLRTGHPIVQRLILDTLRYFVEQAGVDGFRFDLAPVLARDPGFDPQAAIFAELAADPVLRDRTMIAEPWDIGPGGYQLGAFPQTWLEWNDLYRDDVRRFWRGDGDAGALATRLAGSSDVFGDTVTRTVNFVAAHDGFTLADTVAYAERHNAANGEGNRDGHGQNYSWNNGVEGPTGDASIIEKRQADAAALLLILAASRGTIQISAGDEFGRTQAGNNNAYAQDNAAFWIDWEGRDRALEALFARAMAWRRRHPAVCDPAIRHDARWFNFDGEPLTDADWRGAASEGFVLELPDAVERIVIRIDRTARSVTLGVRNVADVRSVPPFGRSSS